MPTTSSDSSDDLEHAPTGRPSPPGWHRRRFTADEVLHMVDCGILTEDDRVELLDGGLVVCEPQGPGHSSLRQALSHELQRLVGPAGFHVRDQAPILTEPTGLPEPDIAVVRGGPKDYLERHPTGPDTALAVEVAKTSRAIDRRKAAVYARGGVAVYWLVDLVAGTLTVHEEPDRDAGSYRRVRELGAAERVAVPVPGVEATFPVRDLIA